MFGLSSFRTQLLLLITGLLCVVLTAVFIAVNLANQKNARMHLEETLGLTSFTFKQDLAARNRVLMEKARLLSGDFAFKEAVATNDHDTILSALENHRMRVMASVMMLATLDGDIIADTLHPGQAINFWPLEALQSAAEEDPHGEASGIQLLDGKPYQLVLMPLFTPEPSAWIAIGFRISDRFSQQLAEQTHSEVSLVYSHQNTNNDTKEKWQVLASTLSADKQKELIQYLAQKPKREGQAQLVTKKVKDILLDKKPHLSLIQEIQGAGEGQTLAVLQRSLEKALKPYLRLQGIMLTLFGLGLLLAVMGAIVISRGLSKPLEVLTQTVQNIDAGHYRHTVRLKRNDELGKLSTAVGHMSKGLQERDQVRDLLGKVVSPEIASELLSKEIELGGEDRLATILFCDIRKFTGFCEKRNPKDILQLLNRYLSSMSKEIERHQGVIDKYIGDAIMALFGVPISIENGPEQAVKSALSMIDALSLLNIELEKEKRSPIYTGIGINTGIVVAGNMGSNHRLNYTVIGDCVNLASRLEGLTRYFGVNIIVSESTAKACKTVQFRHLGRVQVKGKKISIGIYEPISQALSKNKHFQDSLEKHHQALEYFYRQDWLKARKLFEELSSRGGDESRMYRLYLDNIMLIKNKHLPESWSGELVFREK